jgi:hypothetical protein
VFAYLCWVHSLMKYFFQIRVWRRREATASSGHKT